MPFEIRCSTPASGRQSPTLQPGTVGIGPSRGPETKFVCRSGSQQHRPWESPLGWGTGWVALRCLVCCFVAFCCFVRGVGGRARAHPLVLHFTGLTNCNSCWSSGRAKRPQPAATSLAVVPRSGGFQAADQRGHGPANGNQCTQYRNPNGPRRTEIEFGPESVRSDNLESGRAVW